jgi:hypothetical protein
MATCAKHVGHCDGEERHCGERTGIRAEHAQRHQAAVGLAGEINAPRIGDLALHQIGGQCFQKSRVVRDAANRSAILHVTLQFFAGQKEIPLLPQAVGKHSDKALLRRERFEAGRLGDRGAATAKAMQHDERRLRSCRGRQIDLVGPGAAIDHKLVGATWRGQRDADCE